MRTKLKEFYQLKYPSDELGKEIDGQATFKDLFNALDNYRDVYEVFNVGDSIIRERLFEELANIIDVDYSYIYNQWLKKA